MSRLRLGRVFAIALSLFVLSAAFNNCSNTGFESVRTESLSTGTGGALPPPTDEASSPPPSPAPTPTPMPPPTPNPPPPNPPAQAFIFVAQGHVGRTIISCDQGRTWIHDRSDNPNTRCWVDGNANYVECDHTAGSGRGLDYDNGIFFANFGWGVNNATVRRSMDGINWQVVNTGNAGAGVSFYQGFLAWINGGNWPISTDLGATFRGNSQAIPGGYYLARTIARAGNLLLVSSDDPGGLYSRDAGRTFARATLNNVEWNRSVQVAAGNNRLITLSSAQNRLMVANSPDQGATWNGSLVGTGSGWSSLIFNGTEFVSWADGRMYRSTDGTTWTSAPINNADFVNGPVARSPSGTYVSIPNHWGRYYAGQRAYYSMDGITWTMSQFPGGHPIQKIIGGYVDASVCNP